MEKGKVLFLNEREVKVLLTPQKVMELVEHSLADYAKGDSVNPVKLHLPLYPDYDGYINSMPSYIKNLNLAGVKLVSVHKSNPTKYGLPSTLGTIILYHPETGMPFSIMDGTNITAMRTGAVVGINAKYLAKKSSKVLTVIGAGAQGFTGFVMTATAITSIEEVRVVDIKNEAQKLFIDKAIKQFPYIKYVEIDDIQRACTGSDIIISATTAGKALLLDINLDKGTTVIEVSGKLTHRLIEKFDRFIVDFAECLMERVNQSGRYTAKLEGTTYNELSTSLTDGEIGDIILGKMNGRLDDDEIILSKSIGMSIEDVTVAYEAYNQAIKKGLGITLELFDL